VKVFVSYRRSDSADIAGRLADRLADQFGVGSVFKDLASLSPGANFVDAIRDEIAACDAFLTIIGPGWINSTNADGVRRIDDPNDPIRLEIETALALAKPVIPVLVQAASIPSPDALPGKLQQLAYRNAVSIRPDPDFSSDVARLIEALEKLGPPPPRKPTTPVFPPAEIDTSAFTETRVFISHSTADREWVEREVIQVLESKGIKTWYSKMAIKTASQWEREIVRGLQGCDWFLLVASPSAAASEWVKDEVYWAIFHRPEKIIVLIKDPCNLWDFHMRIPRLQNIDFKRPNSSAREELLDLFRTA
jgi:hypothetical protein